MAEPKKSSRTKEALMAKRVCVGGRPKVYDEQKIMEEMREWVKKEDSINFSQFCADRGYHNSLIWKLEKENEEFQHCYDLVKMKLAERRERLVNAELLNYGAWNRYQRKYDPFLNKHETDLEIADSERKKGVKDAETTNLFLLAKIVSEGKIKQE